jgi:hypothetical protein
MEIISHRGYWKSASEKNKIVAFERSFSLSFGTETDIRDFNSELVISHDTPDNNSLSVNDFFDLYNKVNCKKTLALNIKADGLHIQLLELLEKHQIKNYFIFDMSIPDTIKYKNLGMRFFSRQSEFEQQPIFEQNCSGIWLDAFEYIWYDASLIEDHLNKGLKVAIVSSELHGRDYQSQWDTILTNNFHQNENLILCTDIPEQANTFFN